MPVDMEIAPTWEIDPVSGKGVPPTSAQWANLIDTRALTITPPDHLWLLQESSGMLADAIGGADLVAITTAASYGNAVAGWSRVAVGTSDTDANEGFLNTTTVGSLKSSSQLLVVYIAVIATPSKERCLFGLGANNDHHFVAVTPSPVVLRAAGLGGTTAVSGGVDPGVTVHPVVLQVDKTKMTYSVYTDREKISAPWKPLADNSGVVLLGSGSGGAANARYLYAAMWQGAEAELPDAGVKQLLQALGWTVSGY